MAVAPHPDDAEIGCGGTLIRAARCGQATGILELTRGEMGSLGDPDTRLEEARAAARIMGLAWRGNLELPDGRLGLEEHHALELATALRTLRPRLLLLPHHADRHPDHVGAYALGKRALHLAGLRRAPLEGEPFKVPRVLLYPGNAPVEADVLIDVEPYLEAWAEAVLAHASQFGGEAVSETVNPEVVERRKARMSYWGTFAGLRYAEAFCSELPLRLELDALLR
nr:bacillithiol biosynthesis deacetylase BshB1 [Deinobacterium chartae]